MAGRSFSIIILLVLTIISLWIFVKGNKAIRLSPHPEKIQSTASVNHNTPIPQHKLTGVFYQATLGENSQFTLEAASITIRKKRIGFLRFNLLSEAIITDGIIHLYNRLPKKTTTENTEPDKLIAREIRDSLLPSLPRKQPITIKIKPAAVFIHHDSTSITEITSQLATIRPQRNEIIFTSNPKVINGERTLSARWITLSLSKKQIKAEGNISFNAIRIPDTASVLLTDLSLNLAQNVPIK